MALRRSPTLDSEGTMSKTKNKTKADWCLRLPWTDPGKRSLDILTDFIIDAEHELIAVVTALQAHIDLLEAGLTKTEDAPERFAAINRAVSRLLADTAALASISELTKQGHSKEKSSLCLLVNETMSEMQVPIRDAQVIVSCDIPETAKVTASSSSLKLMLKALLLEILHKCDKQGTLRISALRKSRSVSIAFDTGRGAKESNFHSWRLGELHMRPTNGEGIRLAAIAAMARINHGYLSVCNLTDLPDEYSLTFES